MCSRLFLNGFYSFPCLSTLPAAMGRTEFIRGAFEDFQMHPYML